MQQPACLAGVAPGGRKMIDWEAEAAQMAIETGKDDTIHITGPGTTESEPACVLFAHLALPAFAMQACM